MIHGDGNFYVGYSGSDLSAAFASAGFVIDSLEFYNTFIDL